MKFFCWPRMALGLGLYLSATTGYLHIGPFRLGYVSTLDPRRARSGCSLP